MIELILLNIYSRNMKLSRRSQRIIPSQTIALDSLAKSLQAQGQKIINLTAGELDFNAPTSLKQGASQAVKASNNKYTTPAGLPELRQALAKSINKRLRTKYTEEEIIIVNGAKQGLYSLCQTILNPGDEVILPLPAWVSYFEDIKLAGGKAVEVPTDDDFELNIKAIKQALTKKTKAILLNSPNNPTGKVYDKKNVLALTKLIKGKDIWLISDEVYATLTYGKRHVSPITLMPSLKKQFVYIGGASKEMSITGWRIGWLVGPKDLIKGMAKLQSHQCGNVCNLVQLAVLNGLQKGVKENQQYLAELKRRRQLVTQELKRLPELKFKPPEGAFYFFIDITEVDKNSVHLATKLLKKAGVAVVPGLYFGAEGYIRLSFANSYANLQKAMKRLQEFITKY